MSYNRKSSIASNPAQHQASSNILAHKQATGRHTIAPYIQPILEQHVLFESHHLGEMRAFCCQEGDVSGSDGQRSTKVLHSSTCSRSNRRRCSPRCLSGRVEAHAHTRTSVSSYCPLALKIRNHNDVWLGKRVVPQSAERRKSTSEERRNLTSVDLAQRFLDPTTSALQRITDREL